MSGHLSMRSSIDANVALKASKMRNDVRTTLDLDERLLNEAHRLSGIDVKNSFGEREPAGAD